MSLKRSLVNLAKLSSKDVQKLFASWDVILTDCDGVFWRMNKVVAGAIETLNYFRKHGKAVFFLTNNSGRSRDVFVARFYRLGYKCEKQHILSPGFLAAEHLKSLKFEKKVYIIGTDALSLELDSIGIIHVGVGPDVLDENQSFADFVHSFRPDPEIGAVIVGYDVHFSIKKLVRAATHLGNPEVIFLAANREPRYLSPRPEVVYPGVGCIVASVEFAADRSALVLGKPETFVYDYLKRIVNIVPERTLMVGDTCYTDILLGTRCGFQTLLVLTGVTKLADVEKWRKSNLKEELDLVPDFYINSIGDLPKLFDE